MTIARNLFACCESNGCLINLPNVRRRELRSSLETRGAKVTIRPLRLALSIAIVSGVFCGCSTQQAYYVVRAWQQGQCQRLVDDNERDRCLANARMSYSDYREQRPPQSQSK